MVNKILVVDDEPHLQEVIRQTFRRKIRTKEMTFLFANHGKMGQQLLDENPDIDMVISDIRMPEMNGLELLKYLREHFPEISCVMLTAYGDMKHIRAAMNHGAFDFLTKPIDLQDLELTVEKSLAMTARLKALRLRGNQQLLTESLRELTKTMDLELPQVVQHFFGKIERVMPSQEAFACVHGVGTEAIIQAKGLDEELSSTLCQWLHGQLAGNSEPLIHLKKQFIPCLDEARDLLIIPLYVNDEPEALIALTRAGNQTFNHDECALAKVFSETTTLAIKCAQLSRGVIKVERSTEMAVAQFKTRFHEEVDRANRFQQALSMLLIGHKTGKNWSDSNTEAVLDEALTRICRRTDPRGRCDKGQSILLVQTPITEARNIVGRVMARSSFSNTGHLHFCLTGLEPGEDADRFWSRSWQTFENDLIS